MQASKQQSPNCKKSSTFEQQNSSESSNKSIAQRVMEVASNNIYVVAQTSTTQTTKVSGNNSICNSNSSDQEVEDITNRSAKLEIGSTNSIVKQQALIGAECSSSSNGSNNCQNVATINGSRGLSDTNSLTRLSNKGTCFEREQHILLETKVPLPSKNDYQPQEEEVSYYNDDANNIQLDVKPINQSKFRKFHNEHKLSVVVPEASGSTQHLKPNSQDYINDLDEDDYYTRYDNAMVETPSCSRDASSKEVNHRSGSLSIPASPKVQSAPATPCNVTPTTFHQHTSHINSKLNPSPANTLPPDISKTTCRVLPSSVQVGSNHLDELIRRGESSLECKDYESAIRSFSQCIEFATNNQNFNYLKKNFKIYSHRAEAYFSLGKYNEAIEDSMAARELNPRWIHAYYRQGRAQFLIGHYADALAVFSFGLAQDPANKRLFEALVDAALKSSFKLDFEPKYNKLKELDLDKRPSIVVAVLGQELLAKGHGEHAAIILESALKMGSDNKEFRSSILSTICYAYCLMKDYEKAITYMNKELETESQLEDVNGQCRVLSNLGYTYYKMRKFDKSLDSHRKQLTLAMRSELFQQASAALNAIGHVHVARNDYTSALTSHTRCLEILENLGDNDFSQFKETLSIGHIHSMLSDYKAAEDKYNEAIQLLRSSEKINREEYQTGLIMVNFNQAYLALKRQSFVKAKQCYSHVIELAQRIPNGALYEMRASNGMGQAHRLFKNFEESRDWFEKQLQLAENLNDRSGKSQALCNLGMIYQHFKDYNNAWRLFHENLRLVEKDPVLKAYAHSYMGSMCFLLNRYTDAQVHYESSLNAFKDLDYSAAERKTVELNMAAVNERLGHQDTCSNNTLQHKKVLIA